MAARSLVRFLRLISIVACSGALFAQAGGGTGSGGSGGGSTGGSTGTGATTVRGGTTGTTGNTNNCSPSSAGRAGCGAQRPIFLSGQVVMDDGSPVPHNVAIEHVCAGQARRDAYANSQGQFSFQFGRSDTLQDASVASGPLSQLMRGGAGDFTPSPNDPSMGTMIGGELSLAGCELRASLPGYRSSTVDLTTHKSLDNPDVGTIVLQRLDKAQGTSISATAYSAPKDAKKAYEQGLAYLKKDKRAEAQQAFEKAAELYPRHAEAWAELGHLHRAAHDVTGARHAYEQALNADAHFITPLIGLAELSAESSNWDDAARFSKQALELDPLDFPGGYFLNAVANYNLHNFEAAESNAKRAQRLDPQHRIQRLDLLLGNIFIARKDYNGALESMKAYLKYTPNAPDTAEVQQKIAELERIAVKKP